MRDYPNNISLRLVSQRAHQSGDKVSYVFREHRLTFSDLWQESCRAATYLHDLGIHPRQRVLFVLEDSREWPILYHAMIMLGAIPVILNSRLTSDDTFILCHDADTHTVIGSTAMVAHLPCLHKYLVENMDWAGCDAWENFYHFQDTDILHMVSSSGTTGYHRLIVHGWQNLEHSMNAVNPYGLDETSRVLHTARFSSNWGMTLHVWGTLIRGYQISVLRMPQDLRHLDRIVRDHGITHMFFTPTHIRFMVDHPEFDFGDSLKAVWCASEALSSTLHHQFEQQFGIYIHQLYGFSESATCWSALISPNDRSHPRDSIGVPVYAHEYQLRNTEGVLCATGEAGNLWVRSQSQFLGYFSRGKIDSSMIKQGWYDTCDIMYRDVDGFYYFVSRANQLIKIRGEWVNLRYIEDLIEAVPSIRAAVVVAEPDAYDICSITAFVAVQPGTEAASVIKQHYPTQRHLPSTIWVVDEIPLTPTNKKVRQVSALRSRIHYAAKS